MRKYIFISAKIKEYICDESTLRDNTFILVDIKQKISHLLHKKHNPIFAVLFLGKEDLFEIVPFLNEFNFKDISYKVILFSTEEELGTLNSDNIKHISDIRSSTISIKEYNILTQIAFQQIEEKYWQSNLKDEQILHLLDTKRDQEDLINIGMALSTEKSTDKLMKSILLLSKKITGADAGSIYLAEETEDGKKQLRFKYSHTFERDLPFEEHVLSIDKNSIAGFVAVTGEVLNISDVYKLSSEDPLSFNSSFDKTHNYRAKSMLVVPMKNHVDHIIGVIQLINSKENTKEDTQIMKNAAYEIKLENPNDFETKVVSFDQRYESLMQAVAGQAAIAIENNRMIKQIQNQFEAFVKTSVSAIESRDIATSGHSFRVAEICKEIARSIDREDCGSFKDTHFSENEIKEIEYASLLHDYGKVYIDLAIFKKAKKLYPKEFENLILKLNYLYRFIELHYTMQESLLSRDRNLFNDIVPDLESMNLIKEDKLQRIRRIKDKVKVLNEPRIIEGDPERMLNEIMNDIQQVECFDIEGNKIELLTDNETLNLKIKRGSLNPIERKEIESHVLHTHYFLSDIPWPPEFKNIPDIVLKHHEKLDGSGYPFGISGEENIPIQSRMITIADIYDALIASDRPYKRAISCEEALSILEEEAKCNKLDKNILEIFIKYKIYEKIDKNAFKL
ncbi:MAG: HD domain-containing phosphohydrolase [Spirochaetota bacterium]|nr:HD domain-containing phosphohydrolase [Spirochaetota bacterium]